MWNRIMFRTLPSAHRNENGVEICRTVAQLRSALERSKKTPITLAIDMKVPVGGDPKMEAVYLQLPSTLNTAADRILSLFIIDSDFDYTIPLTSFVTKGLKSLQILQISEATKPRRCFEALLDLVDRTAPNLHTMKLPAYPTFVTPGRSCWKMLSSLEVYGLPPLSVLSQCLGLRCLQLHDLPRARSSTEPLHSPPIILPNLERLDMKSFPVTFLRSLSLPALVSLDIDSHQHAIATQPFHPFPSLTSLQIKGRFTMDPSVFVAPSLTQCALIGSRVGTSIIAKPKHYKDQGSSSVLANLELESLVDETDALLPMLRHHASIAKLSLTFVSSTPSVVKSLWSTVVHPSRDEGPRPLCPSLHTFHIKFKSPRYKQVAILGMLQALLMVRESAGMPLAELSFHQFRRGTAVSKDLAASSGDRQEADPDSDQSM